MRMANDPPPTPPPSKTPKDASPAGNGAPNPLESEPSHLQPQQQPQSRNHLRNSALAPEVLHREHGLADEKSDAEGFKVVVQSALEEGLQKAMMDDEDKQVLGQHFQGDSFKEAIASPESPTATSPWAHGALKDEEERPKKKRRFCGMFRSSKLPAAGTDEARRLRKKNRRLWVLLAILAIVIIGAAVGGGVGYYAADVRAKGAKETSAEYANPPSIL